MCTCVGVCAWVHVVYVHICTSKYIQNLHNSISKLDTIWVYSGFPRRCIHSFSCVLWQNTWLNPLTGRWDGSVGDGRLSPRPEPRERENRIHPQVCPLTSSGELLCGLTHTFFLKQLKDEGVYFGSQHEITVLLTEDPGGFHAPGDTTSWLMAWSCHPPDNHGSFHAPHPRPRCRESDEHQCSACLLCFIYLGTLAHGMVPHKFRLGLPSYPIRPF